MDIKRAEDKIKAQEAEDKKNGIVSTITHNVALRELSKLCINAISGKVTEGLHL